MMGVEDDQSNPTDEDQPHILFPIDGDNADALLGLVCDIVADHDAKLYLAAPVTVPNQTPLDSPQLHSRGEREAAKFALRAKQECDDTGWIETLVEIGHNRPRILRDLINTHGISTIITEAPIHDGIKSRLGIDGLDHGDIDGVCDTIFITRFEPRDDIDSVVVPIARGPHSGLAIEIGCSIARQHNTTLELFHVYEPEGNHARQAGQEILEHGRKRVSAYPDTTTTLRGSHEREVTIMEYTNGYDVTVFGAPREGLLRQYLSGSIPEQVSASADGIVLTAHKGGVEQSWVDRWL